MKMLSRTRSISFSLLALFLPALTFGAGMDTSGGTISIYLENDLFAGTDRYYTSGAQLAWSSPNLEKFSDTPFASPFLPLFDLLPYINEADYQKNLVLSLGQNIYTPDNTETYGLLEDDRPYAGWLYLGLGVVWKDATVRNSLVLNIGVVGSWSYAQEAQRLVHDARGLDHPNGWDNQLHNELGINLAYERIWRFPKIAKRSGLDWEFLPHAGAVVGNVNTYANLGAELRFGLNLPDDFGTGVIGPVATTSTPVDGAMGARRSRFDLGMYAFARADGRAVGRNIFLDGNTFGSGPSVGHNPFVADLSVGVAMNIKNTKIAYAFVYRSKEFDSQKEAQIFGTVSINWTF
jgi:lipid A 3-O-deacylase